MKDFSSRFGDRPSLAVKTLGAMQSSRKTLELDDELFLPSGPQCGAGDRVAPARPLDSNYMSGKFNATSRGRGWPKQPAVRSARDLEDPQIKNRGPQNFLASSGHGNNDLPNSPGMCVPMDLALDPDGRRWPKLPSVPLEPPVPVKTLENTMTEQSAELALRCAQIADLCNIRQQQAVDLQNACDEIEHLCASIAGLEDRVARHESEAVTAMQNLMRSENDKATLRAQLDRAQRESAELLQRLLRDETALNDQELALASALERIEELKAELATKPEESARVAAAVEEANRWHLNKLNRRSMHFEEQIKKFEKVISQRDIEIENLKLAHAKAEARCDDLAKTAASLEKTQQYERKKVEWGAEQVEFLETVLRVEREASELKVAELTAELRRARVEPVTAERATGAMRKDGVLVLPKLAARRGRLDAIESDTSISRTDAA
jgi:hypothetical protein